MQLKIDKKVLEQAESIAAESYWKLPMPKEFERVYLLNNYQARIKHFRIFIYIGIFLLALYGVAEIYNVKDGNYLALIMRYGIAVPAALFAVQFFDKPKYALYQDWIISLSGVVICALIFVSRYQAFVQDQFYYYYGYIILICYINIVIQPRFIPSLIASLVVCVGGISFYYFLDMPTNRYVFLVFDTCFFVFLSLVSNYYIQLSVRKLYARSLLQDRARKSEQKAKDKLFKLSNIDALTQLSNRRFFDEAKDSFDKPDTGVLFIDIDHFKDFNDLYGHIAGDDCICEVAKTIAQNVRKNDLSARYGGEEFVILMDATEPEVIKLIGTRIIEQIKALQIPHESSAHKVVTVCVGWSYLTEKRSLQQGLQLADQALYQAKSQGRNQLYPL
ncbi:diguanylate cyclase [Kangiella sp. TOML190]|uniref:diguanylate cyclase n=1 Tax=Kangiella sp. TOML190 TaxID=2931351 RepID=UPI00203C15A1|nr:diguanylate cyclase [Kangiella sp. TOML190]